MPFKRCKMESDLLAYVIFGVGLAVLFVWIIFYYYSGKRKEHVEHPKYKILEDDED